MEAAVINNNLASNSSFQSVMTTFFGANTPDSVTVFFWKFFQCWTTKDCAVKADISDKEVALFFDQLTDLVAAAYILHQANGVSINPQEGERHD
jgi:hypothetical protein